jgi:dihydrofolate reductase
MLESLAVQFAASERESRQVQRDARRICTQWLGADTGAAMRRMVWAEYVSVDGVVDDPSWTATFWNDQLARMQKEQLFRSDALLLGRVAYEQFSKAWPDPDGFADRMNSLPKYVASRTLERVDWNAMVIEGDVAGAVSTLKQKPGGDLLIYGSAGLVHTLVPHDVIDEYRLMVHPVVVGRGRHLFRDDTRTKRLKLADATVLNSGVVVMFYESAHTG